MAYLLTEFDGVALPLYDPEQNDSTAEIQSSLMDSIGGAFDYYGATTRLPRKFFVDLTGKYFGETTYIVDENGNFLVDESGNSIIAGTAVNMLRVQLQELRAKVGVRGALTRIRQDDNVEQWITARLLQVRHDKRQEEMARLATLQCRFEAVHTAWRAATATTTTGNAASGVPLGLTVSNGGDVAVYDAVIKVAVTSGTMTQLDVDGIGDAIDFTWTGSLASGSTLEIDCSAQSVARASGTDQYSGFVLNSGHTVHGWLPLDVGETTLLVTVTGAAATVTITHYNQFR